MKMSLLRNVVSAFERFAPLRLAETAWDNVGVLVEAPYPREVAKRVFLTIDLTPEVLEEALQHDDVGVIVAYHPTIFRGWKRLNLPTDSTRDAEVIKQAMILKLAAKGVSLYCPHTSVDAAAGGINDWLASGLFNLAVESVEPVVPTVESTVEAPQGQGRIVTLREPKPVTEVVVAIRTHLALPYVRLAQAPSNHLVRTIAICAGSGQSVFSRLPQPADLYWTGEMSHHEVLAAVQTKTHVVLCEHTNTERGYLTAVLQRKLQYELREVGAGGVEVVVSQVDRDPLVVV